MLSVTDGEACGLVVRSEIDGLQYVRSTNVASGVDDYMIEPGLVEKYLGDIVAVIHSHPNGHEELSEVDRLRAHPEFKYGIWARNELWVWYSTGEARPE
jgi:proteasome lid subunit RPN8/RPN11